MKLLNDMAAGPYVYVIIVRMTSRILGIIGVGLGVALIAGGSRRFASPGLAVAREVPGEQYTWGVLALLFGATVLAAGILHSWLWLTIATAALATWSSFFAVSITAAAVRDPRASFTGSVTYAAVAAIAITQYAGLRQGRQNS